MVFSYTAYSFRLYTLTAEVPGQRPPPAPNACIGREFRPHLRPHRRFPGAPAVTASPARPYGPRPALSPAPLTVIKATAAPIP